MFSAIFSPNYWILFFSFIHIRFFRIQADFYLCGVLSVCISVHGSLCFFSAKKPFSDKKTAPVNTGAVFNLRPLAPYAQAHIAKPYR